MPYTPNSGSGGSSVPGLADLVARYSADDPDEDPPAPPTGLTLDEARTRPGEHRRVIAYLTGLGIEVRQVDDLLRINDDPDEEELHAWRCREGIAVSVASDGTWLLFTP